MSAGVDFAFEILPVFRYGPAFFVPFRIAGYRNSEAAAAPNMIDKRSGVAE